MTSNGSFSNEPRPRLCHLRRWSNFVGYGFNLHCEKSKPGQFIGKVDPNSPAESAGLREHDRIIEVNFVPIGNENHKQVVQRIKEGVTRNGTKYADEVILLVLDPDADAYYKHKSVVVRSSDPNVEKFETECRNNPEDSVDESPQLSNKNIDGRNSPIDQESPQTPPRTLQNETNREYKHVTDFTGPTVTQTTKVDRSPAISRTSEEGSDQDNHPGNYLQPSPRFTDKNKYHEFNSIENSSSKSPENDINLKKTTIPEVSRNSSSRSSSTNQPSGTLELKMSAAEYREKLKSEQARKRDPRQDQHMTMKQKHDLIDHL